MSPRDVAQLPPLSPIPSLRATELPRNPFSPNHPQWNKACEQCLLFQSVASTPTDLIHSRLLGYLLIEAPYPESRDFLAAEILSRGAQLSELGLSYKTHLMQFCPLLVDLRDQPSSLRFFSSATQNENSSYQSRIL
jgi:hypothetical protein